MSQSAEPRIRIGQVFVSSVAFEHREDVLQLSPRTEIGELAIKVGVQIGIQKDGKSGFVKIVVATDNEKNPLYRFAVEMTGIIENDSASNQEAAKDYLIRSGAFMMYPFLREFVANLTTRGRFGPVWLRPMNFKVVAEQIQKQMDEEGADEQSVESDGDSKDDG